jgi:hypothetical protein
MYCDGWGDFQAAGATINEDGLRSPPDQPGDIGMEGRVDEDDDDAAAL